MEGSEHTSAEATGTAPPVPQSILTRFANIFRSRTHQALTAAIVLYAITFSLFTLAKHAAFQTSWYDLGRYERDFWIASQSLQLSVIWDGHFSPLATVLIMPMYLLNRSPETLLVLQSVVIALSAIPVYLLARDILADTRAALVFAVAYLLYPPLQGVNSFDFHLEAFLPLFFLSLLYYLRRDDWKKVLVFLVLILATIEFASLLVAFLGLYLMLREAVGLLLRPRSHELARRRVYLGLVGLFAGLAWLGLSIWVLSTTYNFPPSDWGNWEGELPIRTFVLEPGVIAGRIGSFLSTSSLGFPYFLNMLAPLLFLAILSPSWLFVATPWLVYSTAVGDARFFRIDNQYPAFVLPFLVLAMLEGGRRLVQQQSGSSFKIVRFLGTLMLVVVVIFGVSLSPLRNWPAQTEHQTLLSNIVSLVPLDASVFTQNEIFPHLTHVKDVFGSMPKGTLPEYILIDTTLAGFTKWPLEASLETMVRKLLREATYGVLAVADGIFLFRLGHSGPPVLAEPINKKFCAESLRLGSGRLVDDPSACEGKALVHRASDPKGFFWYGPYITLPTGAYTATLRLKISENVTGEVLAVDVASGQGKTIFASMRLHGTSFSQPNEWHDFVLAFDIPPYVLFEEGIEIRGVVLTEAGDITLDHIQVAARSY